MPHVASLKNAYRDRPPPRRRREDDDEEEPAEMKVPQSFTFMRREGQFIA